MFQTSARFALFLAFFALAGGHWVVLHSLAWAEMIREYSDQGSLLEAVARTFDREDPCEICHHAAEERSREESRSTGPRGDLKPDFSLFTDSATLLDLPASPYAYPAERQACLRPRNEKPPLPVPRSV